MRKMLYGNLSILLIELGRSEKNLSQKLKNRRKLLFSTQMKICQKDIITNYIKSLLPDKIQSESVGKLY